VKILFTNNAPLIKYGIGAAFADFGNEVRYVHVVKDPNWLQVLDEFQPDYVFNDGGWDTYDVLFPLLTERNIPHIFWAIEDPIFFQELSLPHARKSELVLTTCIESIPDYLANGIEAHLVPFGYHPAFYKNVPRDSRFQQDIVFIGNNYCEFPERIEAANQVLKPLMDRNYNLTIFGNEWWLDPSRPFVIEPRFYGGYLSSEDFSAVCSTVPIILGLHTVVNSKTMMSMRTFEVLGCGGFHLTQWTPAVENFFVNHHHLVWTKSAEETVDLVDFYLARPDLRQKIARQGQEEVYAKHTYHQRVQQILPLLWEKRFGPLILPQSQRTVAVKISNRFKRNTFLVTGAPRTGSTKITISNRSSKSSQQVTTLTIGRKAIAIKR
jgi:spore maturation protein CgeB